MGTQKHANVLFILLITIDTYIDIFASRARSTWLIVRKLPQWFGGWISAFRSRWSSTHEVCCRRWPSSSSLPRLSFLPRSWWCRWSSAATADSSHCLLCWWLCSCLLCQALCYKKIDREINWSRVKRTEN